MKKKSKTRLDLLVVERGLVSSRQKAQALIMAGQILVDNTPNNHPGSQVQIESEIRLRGEVNKFVSRGGIKLEAAISHFCINPKGKVALDVGASTGGFTDVLLQADALRVHALDVGHSQLDWKIRSDPRVIVYEGVNARYLRFEDIGEKVELIVVDVSFISLVKILPTLKTIAASQCEWVTLIKPQFEVGREKVGKGGIVTEKKYQAEAVQLVKTFAESIGLVQVNLIESPIKGNQGNLEYLAHWRLYEDETS